VTNLGDNAGKTNFFYQNDGWGSFTKITTGGIVTDLGDGVGCAWGDYDNDDFLDMFVTNDGVLGEKVNFLYHNNGNGTFIRLTDSSVGPVVTDPALAWDCAWADYDNDGYLDLFVVNAAGLNNLLYHNNRDETFTKITQGSLVNDTAGIAYDRGSRSCTWGDYDNDGFLDLFVGNYGGINSLYRNNGNSNSWIKFKLVGTASNRSAIGAKVRVTATIGGKTVRQLREISGGGGYRSQNGLLPHFGLGDATSIDTVRIEWPSGTVQELHNVAVKQTLKVVEPPRLGGLARQTDDSVQLNLIGAAGVPFRVETSSNLLNWTPLVTITNRSRTEIIVETNAANFPQRFYRALTP